MCPNEIFDPTTRRVVNGTTGDESVPRQHDSGEHDGSHRADRFRICSRCPITLRRCSTTPCRVISDFRHTTIPSIKIDELISSKLKLSGYYSATKTYLAPDQRFHRSRFRIRDSPKFFGADRPPQPGRHADAHFAAAFRRGPAAHHQSFGHPHLQPGLQSLFPARRSLPRQILSLFIRAGCFQPFCFPGFSGGGGFPDRQYGLFL